jgi:XTP/dITP diphosphohydrolase
VWQSDPPEDTIFQPLDLVCDLDGDGDIDLALGIAYDNKVSVLKNDGSGGFGYDPVFYIPEVGQTYAQLNADEKHAISHRGRALQAFRLAIEKEGIFG